MRIQKSLATLLMLGISASTTMAHHSVSMTHDTTTLVSFTGAITRLEWRNPHAVIHLDMKGADGKTISQRVEIAGPMRLQQIGVDQSLLATGESISLQVWLPKPQYIGNIPSGRTLTVKDRSAIDVGIWGPRVQ